MRSGPRILGVLVVAALALGGCGDDRADLDTGPDGTGDGAAELPTEAPGITGTITAVSPFVPVTGDCTPPDELDPDEPVSDDDPPVCTEEGNEILGTVLVEEQPDVQEGRKIAFTVTRGTVLADTDGTELAGIDELHDGDVVDGWVLGDVCAESYPEQCGAAALRRTG